MNCDHVRRQLLAAGHPDRPPAEVQPHLAACEPCRLWQERLVGIERAIPLIPVPPSQKKRQLLRTILAGKGGEWESPQAGRVACSPTQTRAASHSPTIPMHHALTLMAAAILLLVGGWWLFRHSPNPHTAQQPRRQAPLPDPLLANLSEGFVRLTQNRTPRERVEELGRFVDHLHDRTQQMVPAADAATLRRVARLYEQVVHDGMVRGGRALAGDQRAVVLQPLAERLNQMWQDAELWSHKAPTGSDEPLRQIAAVARTGNEQLLALVREGTP